jgi:hypothetical protein
MIVQIHSDPNRSKISAAGQHASPSIEPVNGVPKIYTMFMSAGSMTKGCIQALLLAAVQEIKPLASEMVHFCKVEW